MMTNSTISDNTGGNTAGGMAALFNVQITNSTISGNGGDGFVSRVQVNEANTPTITSMITNSTISGNSGRGVVEITPPGAGAGYAYAPLVLTNDTVANNTGGVALATTDSITLKNTLLKNTSYNCAGQLTTAGYNLDSGNACFLPGGTDLRSVEPKIDPLANNGGPNPDPCITTRQPSDRRYPLRRGLQRRGVDDRPARLRPPLRRGVRHRRV